MIIWILLIIMIAIAIAITLGIVFGYMKNENYRKGLFIGISIFLILLGFCMILASFYNSDIADLRAEYENIMLYNEMVENSENEQVRFGHYEKIMAFNEKYNSLQEVEKNPFLGSLLPKNWSSNISPIEFQFRGVDYVG